MSSLPALPSPHTRARHAHLTAQRLLASDCSSTDTHFRSSHAADCIHDRRSHHVFHDPSTFAGFALHPLEALWTFLPIPLMCCSSISLYLPYHAPFLAFFALLNLYLHCGYTVPLLERCLTPLYLNSSAWHNRHHQLSVSHFGEMLTLWDWMLGTHTEAWDAAKLSGQTKAVMQVACGMHVEIAWLRVEIGPGEDLESAGQGGHQSQGEV